jgi:hypothetical protein
VVSRRGAPGFGGSDSGDDERWFGAMEDAFGRG